MKRPKGPKRKKGKPRGTTGRRPTGLQPGARLSDYPQLTVRMPADVRHQLRVVARLQDRTEWRVLVDAIRSYCGPLITRTVAEGSS